MKLFRTIGMFALLATLLVGLAGCGDSNVFESMAEDDSQATQIEKAIALMNDSRYAEARDLLLTLDQTDPTVRKYLASAYVGNSGFDLLAITSAVADAQENGTGDTVVLGAVYDLVGFDATTGTLDVTQLDAKEAELSAAIDLLIQNSALDPENPDTAFQLGLYALIDTALLLEKMFTATGVALDFTNPLVVTDADIANAVITYFAPLQASVERNLRLVDNARLVLIAQYSGDPAEQNEFAADFEALLLEIGYDRISGVINVDTMTSYLQTLND